MYALAGGLAPDSIREVSRLCYREMLSAGYTSVTEFHYVHHRPEGTPYEDPNALAKAVALAAEDTGIRLLLLPVAYARDGLPRFRDQSVRALLLRVEDLREWSEGRPLVEVGVGAHSVRAVPREWLEEIGRYAHREDLPYTSTPASSRVRSRSAWLSTGCAPSNCSPSRDFSARAPR